METSHPQHLDLELSWRYQTSNVPGMEESEMSAGHSSTKMMEYFPSSHWSQQPNRPPEPLKGKIASTVLTTTKIITCMPLAFWKPTADQPIDDGGGTNATAQVRRLARCPDNRRAQGRDTLPAPLPSPREPQRRLYAYGVPYLLSLFSSAIGRPSPPEPFTWQVASWVSTISQLTCPMATGDGVLSVDTACAR